MRCQRCEYENQGSDKFCRKCGLQLNLAPPPPPPSIAKPEVAPPPPPAVKLDVPLPPPVAMVDVPPPPPPPAAKAAAPPPPPAAKLEVRPPPSVARVEALPPPLPPGAKAAVPPPPAEKLEVPPSPAPQKAELLPPATSSQEATQSETPLQKVELAPSKDDEVLSAHQPGTSLPNESAQPVDDKIAVGKELGDQAPSDSQPGAPSNVDATSNTTIEAEKRKKYALIIGAVIVVGIVAALAIPARQSGKVADQEARKQETPASSYVFVARVSDGDEFFIDSSSIAQRNGFTEAVILTNLTDSDAAKFGYKSSHKKREFDCERKKIRDVDSFVFSEKNALGVVLGKLDESDDWKPFGAESINAALYKRVCGTPAAGPTLAQPNATQEDRSHQPQSSSPAAKDAKPAWPVVSMNGVDDLRLNVFSSLAMHKCLDAKLDARQVEQCASNFNDAMSRHVAAGASTNAQKRDVPDAIVDAWQAYERDENRFCQNLILKAGASDKRQLSQEGAQTLCAAMIRSEWALARLRTSSNPVPIENPGKSSSLAATLMALQTLAENLSKPLANDFDLATTSWIKWKTEEIRFCDAVGRQSCNGDMMYDHENRIGLYFKLLLPASSRERPKVSDSSGSQPSSSGPYEPVGTQRATTGGFQSQAEVPTGKGAVVPKSAEQLYREAEQYYKQKRDGEAFELLTQAAEMGHNRAMGSLGFMLIEGQGVQNNSRRGLALLKDSADRGDALSQKYVAVVLLAGPEKGVEYDRVTACKYARMSESNGLADARRLVALAC